MPGVNLEKGDLILYRDNDAVHDHFILSTRSQVFVGDLTDYNNANWTELKVRDYSNVDWIHHIRIGMESDKKEALYIVVSYTEHWVHATQRKTFINTLVYNLEDFAFRNDRKVKTIDMKMEDDELMKISGFDQYYTAVEKNPLNPIRTGGEPVLYLQYQTRSYWPHIYEWTIWKAQWSNISSEYAWELIAVAKDI